MPTDTTGARAPKPDDPVTLGDERARLRRTWHAGTECRCCGQRVKLYRRKLTAGMAVALLSVLRASADLGEGDEGFLHAEDTLKADRRITSAARGDFAKLTYWGLVERAKGPRADGSSRNGFYRVTERGRLFCAGRLRVRPAVYLYNDAEYRAPEGADTTPVSIVDALGDRFDYAELMADVDAGPVREQAPAGAAA